MSGNGVAINFAAVHLFRDPDQPGWELIGLTHEDEAYNAVDQVPVWEPKQENGNGGYMSSHPCSRTVVLRHPMFLMAKRDGTVVAEQAEDIRRLR